MLLGEWAESKKARKQESKKERKKLYILGHESRKFGEFLIRPGASCDYRNGGRLCFGFSDNLHKILAMSVLSIKPSQSTVKWDMC